MRTQDYIRVTIRVEKDLKESAEILFEHLRMNMSTALNVFLRKAVEEKAIPFPVSTKSAGFGTGYSSSDITEAFTTVVKSENIDKKNNGLPVARYYHKKKQAYLEAADGTREYVNE